MNRLDYTELIEEVTKELTMPGGNFEALYGQDPQMLEQAKFITAVALTAADRFYSRLTKVEFEMREEEEHRLSGS